MWWVALEGLRILLTCAAFSRFARRGRRSERFRSDAAMPDDGRMLRRTFQVAVPLLIWLVVCDVVGVAVCFVFDVLPVRGVSAALPYAIWFVLGVFCGLFTYFTAGARLSASDDQWIERAEATATGTFITLVNGAFLVALCVAFDLLWWRHDVLGEGFVPDSEPLTLTFFGAILASMALIRHTFRPVTPR